MVSLILLLHAGDGLFLGNSMPIRDMEMYAAVPGGRLSGGDVADGSQSWVASGLGNPVASNRGASGIDGVISTAAGFAAGLGRPVTLAIGDVSFLHDVNGLNLLRTGLLSEFSCHWRCSPPSQRPRYVCTA